MNREPRWMTWATTAEIEHISALRHTTAEWHKHLNAEGKKLRDRCYARARRAEKES